MGIPVEPEQLDEFRKLNRLRMKAYRDKNRQRKYSPRMKNRKNVSCAQKESVEANWLGGY